MDASSQYRTRPMRKLFAVLVLAGLPLLGGCTVITIAGAAASVAVGAVKLTGAAIGTAVDLVIPDGDEDEKKK
jgi:hypothetical protein